MTDHNSYTASPIKDFRWHEVVRRRPKMFLRETNIQGFIDNLKWILISSFNMSDADTFSFECIDTHSGVLKFKNLKRPIKDCWSYWYQEPIFPFTLALPVLNALSEVFKVELFDNKSSTLIKQEYVKGVLSEGTHLNNSIHADQFTISFTLDKSIWEDSFIWHIDYINTEIKALAYLNKSVKFKTLYKLDNTLSQSNYYFKNGLYNKVELAKLKDRYSNNCPIIYLDQSLHGFNIEVAFFLSDSYRYPTLNSYVNGYTTTLHGSHVKGLLKGIIKGSKNYITEHEPESNYRITKAILKKNIVAEINIHLDFPSFRGATKEQLDNPEIIKPITQLISKSIYEELIKDFAHAQKLLSIFRVP